ncbi:hypothetical protein [Rubrivirga sp.]|uniref:hypothetical protein n=1 Tax=Rubrivirga sp. TaxID=1885344 RepID=UPI003C76648F
MITTDVEYQRVLQRLAEDAATLRRQRQALVESGLRGDELDRAMAPLLSFHAGRGEEVEAYEAGRPPGDGGRPA